MSFTEAEFSALVAFSLGAIVAFLAARARAARRARGSVLWGCCVGALVGAPVRDLLLGGVIRAPELIGTWVALVAMLLPISYLGARSGARLSILDIGTVDVDR